MWVRLMVGETEPFGIGISASHFSIGTTQITLLNSFGIFSFLSIFLYLEVLCILRIHKFACTGQLTVSALIQAVKLHSATCTRSLF